MRIPPSHATGYPHARAFTLYKLPALPYLQLRSLFLDGPSVLWSSIVPHTVLGTSPNRSRCNDVTARHRRITLPVGSRICGIN